MTRTLTPALVAWMACAASNLRAQTGPAAVPAAAAAAHAAALQSRLRYETYTLPNDLRVILSEDHSTPIVTVDVWYNVGSRNERPGRSGFAHLFEHMMFQGTAHVGKGEHFQLIERAGGAVNASTSEDRTNYYQTLPANRLNLGLWLEADRMRSLAVTPENFHNQREAVKEERRLRVDNQPYQPAILEGLTLLYDSATCFAYAHSVIGSMADLDSAKVEEVQAFFAQYYVPNNATLTVVGDFVAAEARELIARYFGEIPRGAAIPPVSCAPGFGSGTRRHEWRDPLATLPAVIIAYRIPPHDDPDTPALALLGTILGGGESSRLNLSLVRRAQSALSAFAQSASRRGPGFFAAIAVANQGVSADTLEAQLAAQVARMRDSLVTEEELAKARNDFRAGNIFGLQTTMAVAERLQHYAHDHPSIDDMYTDLDRYMTVTAADLQRAARRYLVPENSVAIVVLPRGSGQ
jgi:predicted Zn-dependent peptidase